MAAAKSDKKTQEIGKGKPGPGRPKGMVNKTTKALKEAILQAAEDVGEDGNGEGGTVGYLRRLAQKEPSSFATLLGKVLPMTVGGDPDSPFIHEIRRKIVDP